MSPIKYLEHHIRIHRGADQNRAPIGLEENNIKLQPLLTMLGSQSKLLRNNGHPPFLPFFSPKAHSVLLLSLLRYTVLYVSPTGRSSLKV